jgi:hypothetical protein
MFGREAAFGAERMGVSGSSSRLATRRGRFVMFMEKGGIRFTIFVI